MVLSPQAYALKAYNSLLVHGKATTITSYTDSFNSTTGVNTRTATDHTVQTSPLLSYENKLIDGVMILQGDAMILFANYLLSFTPDVGQTVDSVWFVVGVKPYNYQDQTVAYEMQLRRA